MWPVVGAGHNSSLSLSIYLRQAGKPARGRGPLDGGGSSQQLPLQRRGVQTHLGTWSEEGVQAVGSVRAGL